MNTLAIDKKLAVVAAMVEGNSIRSTERMIGVHRDTIMRLMLSVGDRCGQLLNERLRRVWARHVQVDEIWTYVFKKEKQLTSDDPSEFGDQYVFIAMDADSGYIASGRQARRDDCVLSDSGLAIAAGPQSPTDN